MFWIHYYNTFLILLWNFVFKRRISIHKACKKNIQKKSIQKKNIQKKNIHKKNIQKKTIIDWKTLEGSPQRVSKNIIFYIFFHQYLLFFVFYLLFFIETNNRERKIFHTHTQTTYKSTRLYFLKWSNVIEIQTLHIMLHFGASEVTLMIFVICELCI